jgi:lipopolysaccharide transport system ATP-binding protein
MAAPFRRRRGPREHRSKKKTIWALRDVNFEVLQGEVVGLIGRNGAGKSTLLKILSRITEPTEGYAEIHGRVGSLLEVGMGFHGELTGRENIFLNGAIIGMKRAETLRNFDEIVAFAELEKFIDTPVKRYSTGMYLRLAFGVAAHLEADILLVDEVLAVGDVVFQKKCLGKIGDVSREGRTVFFVSHNMATIQDLCPKSILMQSGRIEAMGPSNEVIAHYLSGAQTGSRVSIADWRDRITSGEARLQEIELTDGRGEPAGTIPVGGTLCFTLKADFREPLLDPTFGLIVHNAMGDPLLDLRSIHGGLRLGRVHGRVCVRGSIENLGLYPGRYLLSPFVMDSACRWDVDFVKLCCTLDVEPAGGLHGDLKLAAEWGKYWVLSDWEEIEATAGAALEATPR